MARNSQDLRRLGDRRGFIWDARTAQVVWFGVGIATAIRWVRRSREPGDSGLGRQDQPRRSKLNPHRDYIIGLIAETPT